MDKYEYKVRADEIKSLISQGEYDEAVKIADSIDWRRVKSVMMLCTISDLYKINRRYEDSRDILLLAYERHAGGRLIVYSLCELSIKLGEFVQALEYYKEFVQLAPKDSGRYILQYKLYEAQEVSLEERIEVLEELKKRDYREKWAYELAYLYHRVGLASKCVEECDEMFLWFGEGRHVLKALELKMLHEPLSEEQQFKYDQMKQTGGFITPDYVVDQKEIQEKAGEATEDEEDNEFSLEENILTDDTQEIPGKEEMDIQVKTVDVSQYNTINLQKELAESMKEFLEQNKTQEIPVQETNELLKTKVYEPVTGIDSPVPAENEGSKALLHQHTDEMQMTTDEELHNSRKETDTPAKEEDASEGSEEVFFGNTEEVNIQDLVTELAQKNGSGTLFAPVSEQVEMPKIPIADSQPKEQKPSLAAASPNPAISNTGVIRTFHKPSGYDDMLTQEYDGQISLVVPEQEKVEKQITGQLSIEDIMAEWERMKQENERKRMEEIRKRVQQQTDTLFADFDESTKSGLLENLEKAMVTAAIKEEKKKAAQERPKVVKVADIDKQEEEQILTKEPEDIEELEDLKEVQIEELEEAEEIEEISETKEAEEIKEELPEDAAVKESSEEPLQDAQAPGEGEEAAKTGSGPRKKGKKKRIENKDTEKALTKEEAGNEHEKAAVLEFPGEQKAKEEEEGENKYTAREMTGSEKEQFAPFIHHKRTRRQIVEAIDNISMASYTGNVVITGEEGTGAIELAKLLVKEIQLSDSNFSGKVAKISGVTMNKKDVASTLSKLSNGALIIESAAGMRKATVGQLLKELNQEEKGLIILMEDTKARMNDFLAKYADLTGAFNLRVDLEALDDQTLVKYAKKYALDQEYAIDELGVLALHTRIADMQTSDHEVTLGEIEELVDEAIYYADKKTPKHFFDVLLGKRYDDEDMIVLREKDFMHY
ncbi:MAG: hypothetical protein K2H52_08300 [Lachnospiraceae bacterium]|nr:hypothetical protein [Lachnospiraceae bacterium]